jgi:hypothetical protein
MADNKDLVRRVGGYSGDEDGSYVIFDSRNPKYGPKKEDLGSSANAEKAAKVLNNLGAQKATTKDDLGIWRAVNAGYSAHTYGQQAIQGLQTLTSMKNGQDLIVYDTEILGTAPMHRKDKHNLNFYTPTEIGFKHVKMVNGKLVEQTGSNSALSMLMRPTDDVYKRLDGIINNLTPGSWSGMTDDLRRTLSDLTLYAGDSGNLFTTVDKDGRKITTVNKQARELHPLKGSILTSSNNIALMRAGLENLMAHGTTPEHAILEMNSFMRGMHNVKFAGYNVYNFDQPMMMDYLNNQIGKDVVDSNAKKALDRLKKDMSLNQIDGLHAVRTLYRDTYSRYGLDVTLETMSDVFGMKGQGQAHHALSDVGVTVRQLNELIADPGVTKLLKTGGKAGEAYGSFNSKSIKVGDRLFGVAGMMSKDAGAYDGIYRKRDGQLTSAYDMTPNPIYRNATYRVENFFEKVKIDGQEMFGVHLYNESDDLHHTIFRSSVNDLQNAIHGHLEHVGRAVGKDGKPIGISDKFLNSHGVQNQDRAARRWRKMFSTESGGGIGLAERMYDALDAVKKIEKDNAKFLDPMHYVNKGASWEEAEKKIIRNQARVDSMIKGKILSLNEWNTDEFVRDFQTMRGRLEGEEGLIRGFMDRLKDSPMAGTSDYQRRSQSLALSEFGKLLDGAFGANEEKRFLANGGKALRLNVGGDEKILNLTDPDGIRGGLYGHLYHKSAGRPDIGTLKKRYRDLLMQLKSYNALEAKQFEQFFYAMDNIQHRDSIDNILGELANTVARARETNSLKGALRKIAVEDPTRLTPKRASKIEKAKAGLIDDLATQAIQGVNPYQTYFQKGKKLQIHTNAMDVINQHDSAVQNIFKRNGMKGGNIKSMQESLSELAEAYTGKGMHVQFRFDGKNNALSMVLANRDVNESLMNGSLKDLRGSNQVAVVNLAHINKDGTLTRGSQNRVARLIGKRAKGPGGGYDFVTGFDEIINTLKGNANVVDDILKTTQIDGKKNGWIKVESHLESRARKAMQNLSMNNRYANPNDKENMFEVKSRAANYIRGGLVDVSDFAEEWYQGWYAQQTDERKKLWRLKDPTKIAEVAGDNKELFVNEMGINARRVFQRQVDQFVNNKGYGLNVGMHSAKDTHVSNYLRSNLDARDLLAFGYFNPMARENIMKTVNYSSLEKEKVVSRLRMQKDANGNRVFSDSQIERMIQRGVVSETAASVLEEAQGDGKLSYLNMRAAYMDDAALKTRAAELVTKYTDMAQQETDPTRKAQLLSYAERLKNAESLSTWDGMMLMSEEAGRAFETTREKKMKISDDAVLTSQMTDFLNDMAQQDGKTFDVNKSIMFNGGGLPLQDIVDNGGQIKNGKITVAEIVKQDLARDTAGNLLFEKDGRTPKLEAVSRKADPNGIFDKWNLEGMRVMGWDAENKTLIMEETVKTFNSTKFISDSGHRITGTFLPAEVIKDLAGGNAQAIVPGFETSKKMYGTELSKFVSLAVDEAKAQIDAGTFTVGQMTKDQALNRINAIMQNSFGIDSKMSRVENGQIIVNDKLGTDGKGKFSYSSIHKFLKDVDSEMNLGLTKSGTTFGNIGIGRQDVHDWENGIGLIDEHRQGLVKYGRKELDMVTARAGQVLGKGSAVVGWLQEHIEQAAIAQNPEVRRIASGLIRTVVEDKNIVPGSGDVVIRTTGPAFGVDDPMGRNTGRTTQGGVREVSMHALADLPEITVKNTKLIADSYAQTILDFGRVKGGFEDGTNFSDAIAKNGGTALLEMPDDTFAKKYMRLVDFGDVKSGTGDTPMLREVQKLQQQIWRGIKEYQSVSGMEEADPERLAKVRGRVDELVTKYEDKAARMVTNARDDGLMKTFGAAKMDMSGRFRIQGVNPFANYEQGADGNWAQKADAKYKEGTVYVSRNRMAEMIGGNANKIAETLGIDINGLNSKAITEKVLDNINEKGLYGFVNRYPTIKQSTIQSMRFEIDDSIDPTDRTARLTVGTATRLKADYDGDFLSGVLAHYSTDKAAEIHKELAYLSEAEAGAGRLEGQKVVADLHNDMNSLAKQMNLTVGELAKRHNEAERLMSQGKKLGDDHQAAYDAFRGVIQTRMTAMDAMETREARLGKEFVGFIDNTRDKVLNLATSTLDVLEGAGKMDSIAAAKYRNSIEDFTARFSQDLISSKKFNIEDEVNSLIAKAKAAGESYNEDMIQKQAMENVDRRWEKVVDMNEAIMNPTQANLDLFKEHNKEIQLFKESEKTLMNNSLEAVQNVARWNSVAGGYNNMSLRMAVSEGQGADGTRRFLSGQGDMIVRTQATQNISNWAPGESTETIEKGMKAWERSVLAGYDTATNGSQSLTDTLSHFDPNDHVLSGATVADEAAGKFRNMASKFTPQLGGGGVMGGVAAFGAMWAASAFVRSGPTPEGLQEQTQQAPAPVAPQSLQTPVARVSENNGEYVNIRVSAKAAKGMSEQDVAALVHQEIGAMTSMKMDTTLNVNDNTQNIDQQWLQGVVANAINKGFGF